MKRAREQSHHNVINIYTVLRDKLYTHSTVCTMLWAMLPELWADLYLFSSTSKHIEGESDPVQKIILALTVYTLTLWVSIHHTQTLYALPFGCALLMVFGRLRITLHSRQTYTIPLYAATSHTTMPNNKDALKGSNLTTYFELLFGCLGNTLMNIS